MNSQPPHEMQLVTTHSSGAEEWHCPECGRRFVAQWEPNFKRVILERGDEEIEHSSQSVNLGTQVANETGDETNLPDPPLSDVWQRWLDTQDLDSDGEDN